MKAVAVGLSVMVAALMLAQPVLAGKTNTITLSDAKDDLHKWWGARGVSGNYGAPWPDNSPIGNADFLDVKEASISKQKSTFVLTMTMWCDDLMADLALPPGVKEVFWAHGFDTNFDGWDEYIIAVAWNQSTFYERTYNDGTDIPIEFTWSITGATITMYLDADKIGNPSSFGWWYRTQAEWSPVELYVYGGYWDVDRPDSYPVSVYAIWPA